MMPALSSPRENMDGLVLSPRANAVPQPQWIPSQMQGGLGQRVSGYKSEPVNFDYGAAQRAATQDPLVHALSCIESLHATLPRKTTMVRSLAGDTNVSSEPALTPRAGQYEPVFTPRGAGEYNNSVHLLKQLIALQTMVRDENRAKFDAISKQIENLGHQLSNSSAVVLAKPNGVDMTSVLPEPNAEPNPTEMASDVDNKKILVGSKSQELGRISKTKTVKPKTHLFEFTDVDGIRSTLRKNMVSEHQYDVRDYYYKTGIFQKIARSPYFESITLGVIVVNALWMAFDTDGNTASTLMDAETVYVAVDIFFLTFFLAEVLIRFMAFQRKCNCCRDAWFVFDSALVFLYVCDPFLLSLVVALIGNSAINLPTQTLRLLRLARLSRLIRMARSFPQLMTMLKSMAAAIVAVAYTLALLMIVTYMFAIALRSMVAKGSAVEEKYFPDVLYTMHILLIHGTFMDSLVDFMLDVWADSLAILAVVWGYVVINSLMVLNMLVGVLCEVISAVAAEEKERIIIDEIQESLSHLLQSGDNWNGASISWTEFKTLMENKETCSILQSVKVDPFSLVEVAEDFFFDEEGNELEIPFDEFTVLVLDVREDQPAKVKDILASARRVSSKFLNFKEKIADVERKVSSMSKTLGMATSFSKSPSLDAPNLYRSEKTNGQADI